MASQLSMLLEQEAGFFVPGDAPSFGSIYSDNSAASQATSDWLNIISKGVSRVVDLEIMKRYSSTDDQLPKTETGKIAGKAGGMAAQLLPLFAGAVVLAVVVFALRK